jgi:dCMP deaminase
MKDPDQLWRDICYRYANQSKCKSRQVGCVLVFEGRSIGQGWNGAPEGSETNDCERQKCITTGMCSNSNLSDAICCHAEINCIAYCARHGVSTRGSSLYCTTHPCLYCSGAIVGAGIKEVIYDQDYINTEKAHQVLKKSGIKIRKFTVGN